MRIAYHVPRASFLAPGDSGDNVLVAGLASGLRERGHDLRLVSTLDARELGRGRVPGRRALAEAVRVGRRMRRFAPDAWLVYMPSVTYPDLFGWWQRPRRYVLFAADAGRAERLPRVRRPLFRLAHRHSLRAADAVTVYRPRSAERVSSLGVDPSRIELLPPAVVPPEPPSREEARRTLALPADALVVVCVSRLTGRKADGRPGKTAGVVELLRSLAAFPSEVVCLVVGDGEGRAEVEAERVRLGLGDRVRFAGAVPNDRVPVYLAAADVFAYPYDLDRPWMAALEAQACARPVVTMRTGSAELTIEDGRTGLLADDLEEFRSQLAALIADPLRRREMGAAAREYVMRRHSLDARVGELEDLLAA